MIGVNAVAPAAGPMVRREQFLEGGSRLMRGQLNRALINQEWKFAVGDQTVVFEIKRESARRIHGFHELSIVFGSHGAIYNHPGESGNKSFSRSLPQREIVFRGKHSEHNHGAARKLSTGPTPDQGVMLHSALQETGVL